jgi:hypothetical protein
MRELNSNAMGTRRNLKMAKVDSIIGFTCKIAVVTLLGMTAALGDDSRCYLPVVGPTQLRFERVRTGKPFKLPPLSMENASASEATIAPDKTDVAPPADTFASGSADLPARLFLPTTLWLNHLSGQSDDTSSPPADVYVSSSTPQTPPPASDLLNITPQMLVEYFQPGQYQHKGFQPKGASPSVYVPVDFKPATPTVSPNSSATYNTSP